MKKSMLKLLCLCVCFLASLTMFAQEKKLNSDVHLRIISRIKLEFIEDAGGRIVVQPLPEKGENGCMIKYLKPLKNNKWQKVSLKFKALQSGNTHFSFYMRDKRGLKNAMAGYLDDVKIDGVLVENGDFSRRFVHWSPEKSNEFPIKYISKKKSKYVRINSKKGISRTFVFEAGKTYEFSFRVKSIGELKAHSDDISVNLSDIVNVNLADKNTPFISDTFAKFNSPKLYNGVVFAPSVSGENNAVIFRSSKYLNGLPFTTIKPEKPALEEQFIYILHTACNDAKSNEKVGSITLVTDQGNKYYREIKFAKDVGFFGKRGSYNNAVPIEISKGKFVYFSRIEMPNFENVVSMFVSADEKTTWALLGITISDKKIYPFEVATPSPQEWTKADIPEVSKIVKGSALDFSDMLGTPIPAGSAGRVIISERGTLAFENSPEKDVRFRSYSFWSPSRFVMLPKEERYEKIKDYASRVREQGYNLVRIKLDYLKSHMYEAQREELYESTDFLLNELRKNGVYYHLILGTYDDGRVGYKYGDHNDVKMYTMLGDEQTLQFWKKNTIELLTHINKYTGVAYKDDTALLCVEYYNELTNSIARLNRQKPETRKMALERFVAYLKTKYSSIDELKKAWTDAKFLKHPKFDYNSFDDINYIYTSSPDWQELCWNGINKFGEFAEKVVKEVGYKGIIGECNTGATYAGMDYENRFTDMMIVNSYYSHPSGFGGQDISCNQASILNKFWINGVIGGRVNNAPSAVTEYNYCFWNPHRYEICALVAPYCAFQNFSLITVHQDPIAYDGKYIQAVGAFSVGNSPVLRASELLNMCFFQRGDVKPSAHRVNMKITNKYLKTPSAQKARNQEQTKIALLSGYTTVFEKGVFREKLQNVKAKKADMELYPSGSSDLRSEEWFQEILNDNNGGFDLEKFVKKMREKGILRPTNKTDIKNGIFQTDTEQITLDSLNRSLSVITDCSEIVAMANPKTIQLGALKVISSTEPASIGICSLDGKKIPDSSRMVFVYATREGNATMKMSPNYVFAVSLGKGVILKNGIVKAELKVDASKKYAVYPLSLNGDRRERLEMPVENGVMKITIDNSKLKYGSTTMFEIVAEK
ncbi:MAG: hypothetical protein E7036_04620 [Opitutales bacterium]|nr:hypothetical protein [Opitutales bacterium]